MLIAVMVLYGLSAGAQMRKSDNFVYLYSDSVIYADHVRLRADFFNTLQLRADTKRIPLEQVKFFNDDNGFFANIRRLSFVRNSNFVERIIEGKINIFKEIPYTLSSFNRGHGYRRSGRNESIDMQMYYNKGYADLKKVTYTNLRMDMADDQRTLDLLEGYRKNVRTTKTLYISAGASLVAGFASFVITGLKEFNEPMNTGFNTAASSGKSRNFAVSFALIGIGAGLATGGYINSISGLKRLEEVVDVYNR